MTPPFVSPNFHVILIHYPLALFTLGLVIELFGFLWPKSSVKSAGRWMIFLGVLSSLLALTSGLYAARQVLGSEYGATWLEIKSSARLSEDQWLFLTRHFWLNAAASVLSVAAVMTWVSASDPGRARLRWPILGILTLSLAAMLAGAWHGGEMSWRMGVGMQIDPRNAPEATIGPAHGSVDGATNKDLTTRVDSAPTVDLATKIDGASDTDLTTRVDAVLDVYAPIVQVHTIAAGAAAAVVLVAIALSFRRINLADEEERVRRWQEADPAGNVRMAFDERALDRHLTPPPAVVRFYLMGALALLLTAVGGVYLLALIVGSFQWSDLQESVRMLPRRLTHTILGASLVALTLLLAILARWFPRHKGLVATVAILLIACLSAQFIVGATILFDSADGSPLKLNPASEQPGNG